MPGIAAIEHSLGDVDSRACHVRLVVNVLDSIDRTAMNAHPHPNVRMILQDFTDLNGTPHWLFWVMKKKERHPVSRWHSDEFARCFCCPKTLDAALALIDVLQKIDLIVLVVLCIP